MDTSALGEANMTDVSEVALEKAADPMDVTLAGMVMAVSPDAKKAADPMDVTLAGMVMEVSADALLKVWFPMDVTPSGITTAPVHLPLTWLVTLPAVIV